MKRIILTAVFFGFLFPMTAFAQDALADIPSWVSLVKGLMSFLPKDMQGTVSGFIGTMAAVLVSLMAIMRALSEILGLFADKTKTDIDNKIIEGLGLGIEWCAKITGWFGLGYPGKRQDASRKKHPAR